MWCGVCEKSFYDTNNLRKHVQKFHPDKIDKIAPRKTNSVKTVCNSCGKHFSEYSSLNRHVKRFHPDKFEEKAPRKTNSVKTVCNDCGKHFSEYSSLKRHVKKFHPDKINALTKVKAYNYECGTCNKHFTHLRNLTYHQRNHHIESTERLSNSTNRVEQNLKCCLCKNEESFKKDEILQHFKVVHDIELFSDNLKFSDESEFYMWKGQIETETKSIFISKHGSYPTKNYLKKQFICHRSGTYKPEGRGIRRLKGQGTNKINGYCPAEISLKVLKDGSCEVNFQTVHIGHNQDLGHLTLSKAERETIAAKIAAKIPFEAILDEVREESIAENKFERVHLLRKKDLYNIEQCFNLKNESIWHANDAISVDGWVKEVEHSGCILMYKPQDTLSEKYPLLREEDFFLIIMNRGQEEMLEKYGSDCICIDGTPGLNEYEFELVTLLVLDDMREGFPSAFLISNRTDEVAMSVFFSEIKNKLETELEPTTFMSHMAHSFYNAWLQVMGPVQHRLFCSWHVDKAWRKNLCKIKTKEKQVSIYKILRTLLQERDENAFSEMCNNFMDILVSDDDTSEFGTYFQEYYLKYVQSWAYCYQINCGINTNVHLEQMHRTLKHIYLKGKVVKRLDKAINILMRFTRDKLFDRLIVMNKAKICSKIRAIRSRHQISELLDDKLIVKTETGFEVPSRSRNEIYLIQERQPSCTCKLICTECQICLHHYSCTCIDSCIKLNMCKHIHLIQRFLKNDIVCLTQDVDTHSLAESGK